MVTAQEAFNRLERDAKGNEFNSLKGEKEALKSVKREDILGYKDTLDTQKFDVDGVKLTMKQIVQFFNTQTNSIDFTLRVKGKNPETHRVPVAEKSDLAAAIQFYLIANGKDIRTNKQRASNPKGKATDGIDGQLGECSKNKISELKNDWKNAPKQNVTEKSDQTPDRVYDLLKYNFKNKVGKYSGADYNLLFTKKDGKEGALKYSKILDNDEVEIKYKSKVDSTIQTIKVDAKKCMIGDNYSVNKFGKAIEDTILARETEIQDKVDEANRKKQEQQEKEAAATELAKINGIIKKGIEDFKPTNKVLKEYVDDKEIKFSVEKIEGNAVTVKLSGIGQSYVIDRSQVAPSSSTERFKKKTFEDIIKTNLLSDARLYVGKKLDDGIDKMTEPATLGTITEVKNVRQEYSKVKARINSTYGEDEFKAQKDRLQGLIDDADAKMAELQSKAEAKEEQQKRLDAMNKIGREIDTLCRNLNMAWSEKPNLSGVVDNMKKYVDISQNSDGFVMSAKQDVKAVYDAAGNGYLYTLDMEKLQSALSTYSHQKVEINS